MTKIKYKYSLKYSITYVENESHQTTNHH